MEDRSSRRVRALVTRMAQSVLSANEVASALISMVARSTTRSNQRPDTLMQDRSPPSRRKPLATHGRTIHKGQSLHFCDVRTKSAFHPIATVVHHRQTDVLCHERPFALRRSSEPFRRLRRNTLWHFDAGSGRVPY